ncbi:hypothetical protein HHI36_005534 [Cryptolaemus montrouzieri]|uniref:Uncharacterized protein n=1 Tax=Cryptolaemus montrouzieri TaxID=559131 RepID=A0ABD2NUY4_9CUCU
MSPRFSHLENDRLFATATFIDPRYKLKFSENSSTKDQVVKNISDIIGNGDLHWPSCSNPKRSKITNQDKENFGSYASHTEESVSLRGTIQKMMDSSESEGELEKEIPNSVEVFIKKSIIEYILDKRIKTEEDPLQWRKVDSTK